MSIDATFDPSLCVGSDHLPIHYALNFDVVRSISTRFNEAKMELDVFLAIYWVPHPVGNIVGPRVHGGDLRRCTIF